MGTRLRALVTLVTAGSLLVSSPAWAQQHVVDPAVMYETIASHQAADTANRQTIERVLARPDVQVVAARLGLDIKDARTAIATVSGDELAEIAQTAQVIDQDLAGGQNQTITISVVTLLLIIIIVILVAD